eukprot:m.177424 g.177424  ORF g.177424 m.177424 type:complete len:450 (-) comp24485_c1_seq2:149-1498(-)
MGSYLTKPKTAKISANHEGMGLKVGVSEMQGWRVSMEDACCVDMDFREGMVLCGVLDGHGGSEVSKFVAARFPDMLRGQKDFQKAMSAPPDEVTDLLGSALRSAFLEIDAVLLEPASVAALVQYAGGPLSDSDDDPEGDETSALANDASIPIEKLIAEYVKREAAEAENGGGAAAAEADADPKSSLLAALLNGDPIAVDDDEGESDDDDDDDDEGNDHEIEESGDEEAAAADPPPSRKRGGEATATEDCKDTTKRSRVDDCGNERVGVTSGTTAVFALICTFGAKRVVVVANAGDSRAVLCRSGKALDLSEDHKPEDDIELARVEAAGGRVGTDGRINGGLNLSRALGDHQFKRNEGLPPIAQLISPEPDITVTVIQPGDDFLVIACDGIWNSLTSDEVVRFVDPRLKAAQEGAPVSKVCEELCDACMSDSLSGDGTGLDNETAMVIVL